MQLFKGDSALFEHGGIMLGLTRGRTALQEARDCGKSVALIDWFDPESAGEIGFAASDDKAAAVAAKLIADIGRAGLRIADRPGLIVMRTLAQLANGAADAVLEQVADEAGIDAALRFGANYPFGPFAWMDKLGRSRLAIILDGVASATGTGMYRPSYYLRDSA